ncbi:MAG: hypothetical protein AB1700_05205 [Bacillota bacterium]
MRTKFLRTLSVSLLTLLFASGVVGAGYHADKGCRECTLDLSDGGWLYITTGSEAFYTWQNIGKGWLDDLYVSVSAVNRPLILGRYLKVGEKTLEVEFLSSDRTVVAPVENGYFRVVGPGRATISIRVEDKQVDIPINIVALPFQSGTKVLDVIEKFGLPDYETRVYIPWPDSKFVDGIFYYRKDNGLGQQAHHWMYKAYPGLILSLDEKAQTVRRVYNLSWYTAYMEWLKDNR